MFAWMRVRHFIPWGTHSFRELARDAKAVVKVKGILLINTDIIDDYLELFREEV